MPALYVKGVFTALLVGVIAGVASSIPSGRVHDGVVIAAVFVVFVVVSLRGYTRRMRTTYTITDRRLTIGTGLLYRNLHEARLEHVQNVNARQTILERLLGVGTVHFDTAAGVGYGFTFRGVSDPGEIARTVDDVLCHHRRLRLRL